MKNYLFLLLGPKNRRTSCPLEERLFVDTSWILCKWKGYNLGAHRISADRFMMVVWNKICKFERFSSKCQGISLSKLDIPMYWQPPVCTVAFDGNECQGAMIFLGTFISIGQMNVRHFPTGNVLLLLILNKENSPFLHRYLINFLINLTGKWMSFNYNKRIIVALVAWVWGVWFKKKFYFQ